MRSDKSDALTYFRGTPDVRSIRNAYDQTIQELESYFDVCREAFDERNNFWPGKSRDLRKHGADAFPWEGASDLESYVIEERISRLSSLFMQALQRANIRAFPTEGTDAARAKIVSSFLKWMTSSGYIPRFFREMELGANYMLERGILITYVGWLQEDKRVIQKLDLQQIEQLAPELADLLDSEDDEEVIVKLKLAFDGVTDKRAKRAIKDLRRIGYAELPTVRRSIDAPEVKTLAPDGDFFFPSYVTDPQRAPYCFWRSYYTAQELENKVLTDGWDEDFVQKVINNYSGVNIDSIESEQEHRRSDMYRDNAYEAEELIEIIHCYQRLVDPEDGCEGIYCTVFHRDFSSDVEQDYAKFELLNGYDDYPVVVTRLSEETKRLYDTRNFSTMLKGLQHQIKAERDCRIDRSSLVTCPPIMHPPNQPPQDWGPGRFISRRRADDYQFADVPSNASLEGSIELEKTLQEQADRIVGLDDSEISNIRKQFLVDKFLRHCAEVLKMCFVCFQRFGPDYIFFRVTGVPDPQQFQKGSPDENFDITISFDSINTDPDTQESKIKQLVDLVRLDRNGRINMDNLLMSVGNMIDPVLSDSIMQEDTDASAEMQKQILDDLSKIFAGIEMPARPNGGQTAVQMTQQYMQQPDIMQRMQTDPSFAQRIQKYLGQYTFQEQQIVNATEYGQLGTAAAQMGEMKTQEL